MLNDFDLLTLAEVAKLLHGSKAHVGNVVGCTAIPCVRLGRRKLVRRESPVRWIEENENNGKMVASPEWVPEDALEEEVCVRGIKRED